MNSRPAARRQSPSDEGPSADDLEKFGGVTRTCPSCGKEVFDDAALCYHCGHALDGADRPVQITKTWIVLTVLLLVGVLVLGIYMTIR